MVTKKQLAKRIRDLREDYDLSQDDLAKKLGVKRPTITQIESGQREVSGVELARLANIFDMTVDNLLDMQELKIMNKLNDNTDKPKFNKDKFKQVLLYVLEKCGGKPNVGETVIYKLLYFIDFNFYEIYEEYLTGESYRRITHGPAPCHFHEIVNEMVGNGDIKKITSEYYGKYQKKYLPQINPDLSKLNGQEIGIINNAIDRLSSLNARAIEDYSHEDIPYETAEEKEIIDYETVFYRRPSYSARNYPDE